MSRSDTPAKFAEPWHAQVLGLAQMLVDGGHISANDWAEALGAEIADATERGAPDTEETYFLSTLAALERVSTQVGIGDAELDARTAAWRNAYLNTPHGRPVNLPKDA